MNFVGIDLAAKVNKPTGFCSMNENLEVVTKVLFKDKEIISEVIKFKPKVVSIDAPLFLPKGEKNLKNMKNSLRKCDLELKKLGIKFFPLKFSYMKNLTLRGIRIKNELNKMKIKVIETYPGGAQDILKLPRKKFGIKFLKEGLEKLGIKGMRDEITHNELDAVTCALVSKLYYEKNFLVLGDKKEGLMILPKP